MTRLSNYYTKTVEVILSYRIPRLVIPVLAAWAITTALPVKGLASDFFSARTAALGGAGHAGPFLNDSIYLNPAFIPFTPTNSISFNYTKQKANLPPSSSDYRGGTHPHGRNYSLSFMDGRNEFLQGGVAYTRREDAKIIHVTFAKQLIREFSVGIGGKLFTNRQAGLANHINFGVYAAYLPASTFQVAVAANNLASTDKAASKARDVYPEFVLGTKVIIQQMLMLYADPNYTPSHTAGDIGFNLGTEIAVMKDFFLRAGTFRKAHIPFDRSRGNGYGLGAGWIAPKLSIDYAYSRISAPRISYAHQMGMTVYF